MISIGKHGEITGITGGGTQTRHAPHGSALPHRKMHFCVLLSPNIPSGPSWTISEPSRRDQEK